MFGENKEMSERCFDHDKIIASSELFVEGCICDAIGNDHKNYTSSPRGNVFTEEML